MKPIAKIALVLVLITCSHSYAQKKPDLFKGANSIEINTDTIQDPLKAAGRFLVSKGYTIEKLDRDFGLLVSSSKACVTHRAWMCRFVVAYENKILRWKTEGRSTVSFGYGGHQTAPQWTTAKYGIGWVDILENSKEVISDFKKVSGAGEIWYTVKE